MGCSHKPNPYPLLTSLSSSTNPKKIQKVQVPRATMSGMKIRKNASHINGLATCVSRTVHETTKWRPGAVQPKQRHGQGRRQMRTGLSLCTRWARWRPPRAPCQQGALLTLLRVDFLYNRRMPDSPVEAVPWARRSPEILTQASGERGSRGLKARHS